MFSVTTKNITGLAGCLVYIHWHGTQVCIIQHFVSHCCGLNTLHGLNRDFLTNKKNVEALFEYIKQQPWEDIYPTPGYAVKHFFFTTGIGLNEYGEPRERYHKYLIEHPSVKLINRYPSASEPGHDVAIYFVDLTISPTV